MMQHQHAIRERIAALPDAEVERAIITEANAIACRDNGHAIRLLMTNDSAWPHALLCERCGEMRGVKAET